MNPVFKFSLLVHVKDAVVALLVMGIVYLWTGIAGLVALVSGFSLVVVLLLLLSLSLTHLGDNDDDDYY